MEFLSLSCRRSSARNVPSGEERGETDVFAGYFYSIYSKTVAGGKFHGAYIKQNTQKKQTNKQTKETIGQRLFLSQNPLNMPVLPVAHLTRIDNYSLNANYHEKSSPKVFT